VSLPAAQRSKSNPWTVEEALGALADWMVWNDELPNRHHLAECGLPSSTTLRRLFGSVDRAQEIVLGMVR